MEIKEVEKQPKGWEHFKEAGFSKVRFLPIDECGNFHCLLCDRKFEIPDERAIAVNDTEFGAVYFLCYPECDEKVETEEEAEQMLEDRIKVLLERGDKVEVEPVD